MPRLPTRRATEFLVAPEMPQLMHHVPGQDGVRLFESMRIDTKHTVRAGAHSGQDGSPVPSRPERIIRIRDGIDHHLRDEMPTRLGNRGECLGDTMDFTLSQRRWSNDGNG